MKLVTAAWVLGLLNSTADPNATWKDTYESTAIAMAESANAHPLFTGDDGPAKTGTLFVSVSWFESRHNPKAEGDKRNGRFTSFCLGQINDTNFPWLGITKESILGDVRVCIAAMSTMLRRSLRICSASGLPFEDHLSWYAAGGDGCFPVPKSGHRVRKAQWLFAHYPVQ